MKEFYESDSFFKKLAADYVLEKGAELKRESTGADEESIARLDVKMMGALAREKEIARRRRRVTSFGAVAASLVAVLFVAVYLLNSGQRFNDSDGSAGVTSNASPSTASGGSDAYTMEESADDAAYEPAPEMAGRPSDVGTVLASLTAPDGWQIAFTDVDGDITIFHLESNDGARVVVLAGEPIYDTEDGEFRQIYVNETPAYMLIEDTHSILFYNLDGFQFILSTDDDYGVLIELARHWV